jgi:hypothetical protein
MEQSTYPFPLAVNSSHHSHYHRFLLGADPRTLSPFPKPYCVGSMAGCCLGRLADGLDLPRWRKLYHGAFPWTDGFGPEHYDLGNVPPHRPLPRPYCRPPRRFAAYDFVQVADPSLSALALVAGDRRVIERFRELCDGSARRIEEGAAARHLGPRGSRVTGRILAGQFLEPNDRWLMPFLHAHTRVLNLTSFGEAPARLSCVDAGSLARAAGRSAGEWAARQAGLLSDLGYRVSAGGDADPWLRVEGVSDSLVAAMQAPRIAVLRVLERIVAGDRPPSAERLGEELPDVVIAAMAEQVGALAARSLDAFKPPKVGIPSRGPWRSAVREHLSCICPDALERIDAAAVRARAEPAGASVFPCPPLDCAHCHAPSLGALEEPGQSPADPELGAGPFPGAPGCEASPWLASEFERTLAQVNESLVRSGPRDPLVSLRSVLARVDRLTLGADPGQLRQSGLLLEAELGRRAREHGIGGPPPGARGRAVALQSLDELFEGALAARVPCVQEIGGRSL